MKFWVLLLPGLFGLCKGRIGEICLGYIGVVLNYFRRSDTTFQFDLCEVIGGCADPVSLMSADVYLCMYRTVHQICQSGYGGRFGAMCPGWDYVNWWTGRNWSPSVPQSWSRNDWEKITFTRGHLEGQTHEGLNPLLFSIKGMELSPEVHDDNGDNRLFIVLGVYLPGQDPKGIIQINFINELHPELTPAIPAVNPKVVAVDFRNFTAGYVVKIATGYGETNIWVEWILATAKDRKMTNCVACSAAWPNLYMTPAPLLIDTDPQGFQCTVC